MAMTAVWIVEAADSVTKEAFRTGPFDTKLEAVGVAMVWVEDGETAVSIRRMWMTEAGYMVEKHGRD